MVKPVAMLLVLGCLLTACSYGDSAAEPEFPKATVLLDDGEETTLVTVEVAETAEQRASGLAGRESLEEDNGMVFVFFEEQEAGLALEDTRIPLSIAYFDDEGTIVGIADADPCTEGTCEAPAPAAPYMGALAVDERAFDEWGITEGDEVHLTR